MLGIEIDAFCFLNVNQVVFDSLASCGNLVSNGSELSGRHSRSIFDGSLGGIDLEVILRMLIEKMTKLVRS